MFTEATRDQPLLVLAYKCDSAGCGNGWENFKWCEVISSYTSVTLVTTRPRDSRALETSLPNVNVVFLGQIAETSEWHFFKEARFWLTRALSNEQKFAVAHQLTKSFLKYPSPLLGLGIPYLIGSPSPDGVSADLAVDGRNVSEQLLSLRESPLVIRSLKQAELVFSDSRHKSALLKALALKNVVQSCRFHDAVAPKRACVSLAHRELFVLTYGRESVLKRVLTHLSSQDRVSMSCLDQSVSIQNQLELSDLLVVSEDSEVAKEVIREALQLGVPVLTFANSEGGKFIDRSCGVLMSDSTDPALEIVQHLKRLRAQPYLLTPMRHGARRRARNSNVWFEGGKRIGALYSLVVSSVKRERMCDV